MSNAEVVFHNTGAWAEYQASYGAARAAPGNVPRRKTRNQVDKVRRKYWYELSRRELYDMYRDFVGQGDEHLLNLNRRRDFALQHNLPVWAPEPNTQQT